ncbi:MAG: LicD family protein [Gammaproteobacteria bacterium]|nr:LicD family protein [Gammaproteobacteria bacterium]
MAGSFKLIGQHLLLAEKTLALLGDIFDRNKIDYILEGGTLLGIVREDRLLPWDTDIDISIRADQAEKVRRNLWKFWIRGYKTRVKRFKKDVGPFKKGDIRIIKIQKHFLYLKKYELLDIFVKYKVGDEYLNIVGKKPAIVRNFPKKYLEEFEYVEFNGKKFKAPINKEDYLESIYGDWKTPVKEWDYTKDNKRVKEVLDSI